MFTSKKTHLLVYFYGLLMFFANDSMLLAKDNDPADSKLLDEYINTKNKSEIIVFDADNIKQFWVDKSVYSKEDVINIHLNEKNNMFESVPLRLQLKNVKENQDCRIEVITQNNDMSFSVVNEGLKKISNEVESGSFINYSLFSTSFHLENTNRFGFNIVFSSKRKDTLPINKIILSFSRNKSSSFLQSPGTTKITKNDFKTYFEDYPDNSFSIVGRPIEALTKKRIYITDNELKAHIKIRNIGETPVSVSVGYALYDSNGVFIAKNNYPYKGFDTILNVVSTKEDTITVDALPKCEKGCFIGVVSKEDLNDVPNRNLLDGRVLKTTVLENGNVEIVLDKPLRDPLEKGTKLRIHEFGSGYIYTNYRRLAPGEEVLFDSGIKMSETCLKYSPDVTDVIPRGAYYVIPVVVSNSEDSSVDNILLISDYSITY